MDLINSDEYVRVLNKMIEICEQKIIKKGNKVNVSFYAFFENKNLNPKILHEVATWWILIKKLDHFEKATKIKIMLEEELNKIK